jgi:hypothetical protein
MTRLSNTTFLTSAPLILDIEIENDEEEVVSINAPLAHA